MIFSGITKNIFFFGNIRLSNFSLKFGFYAYCWFGPFLSKSFPKLFHSSLFWLPCTIRPDEGRGSFHRFFWLPLPYLSSTVLRIVASSLLVLKSRPISVGFLYFFLQNGIFGDTQVKVTGPGAKWWQPQPDFATDCKLYTVITRVRPAASETPSLSRPFRTRPCATFPRDSLGPALLTSSCSVRTIRTWISLSGEVATQSEASRVCFRHLSSRVTPGTSMEKLQWPPQSRTCTPFYGSFGRLIFTSVVLLQFFLGVPIGSFLPAVFLICSCQASIFRARENVCSCYFL